MAVWNYKHLSETQINVPTEDGTTTVSLAWMYKNRMYNGEWVVYVHLREEKGKESEMTYSLGIVTQEKIEAAKAAYTAKLAELDFL